MPVRFVLLIVLPLLQQFIPAVEYCHSHSVAHRWVLPDTLTAAAWLSGTFAHPGRQQSSTAKSLVLWQLGNFKMCTETYPLLLFACKVVQVQTACYRAERVCNFQHSAAQSCNSCKLTANLHHVSCRDLKLDNTLLDGSHPPLLKLCDFGFAKKWEGAGDMYTYIG